MKKKSIKIKSISLDKETVARLETPELQNLVGGGSYSCNGGNTEIDGNDDEQITTIQSCCNDTCNYN